MRGAVVALALALSACSDPPVCPTADGALTQGADAIPCADAHDVRRWVQMLAGRPLTQNQRDRLLAALQAHAVTDPAAVRAVIEEARTALRALAGTTGLAQAEARSRALFVATAGGGVLPADRFPTEADVLTEAAAIWARDDAQGLVLAETDIEGWIRYASLCREVQGGTPLSLSVATRVSVYRDVVARWRALDEAGRIGLSLYGAHGPEILDAWRGATYDVQSRFRELAPLPPPMTGDSVAYLQAVTQTDVRRHAEVTAEVLGPLASRVPGR